MSRQQTIKAIPTEYKGFLFRSRLEARWAVWFDEMNLEYEYETEGWEVAAGVWYLPDFRLETMWVEIKHKFDDDASAVDKMGLLVAGVRVPGVIVYGDPLDHYAVLFEPHFIVPGYRRTLADFTRLAGAGDAGVIARRADFKRGRDENSVIGQQGRRGQDRSRRHTSMASF